MRAWLAAIAVVFAFSNGVATAQTAPIVHTPSGDVSGVTTGQVEVFKGIPFAAPPVGDLRWRAPQPVQPWTGVLNADHYGHDCMQVKLSWDGNAMAQPPSEDCLVLNVWRPAQDTARGAAQNSVMKLPVIVWIYGGAFVNGGSSLAIYDGSTFARDGVVFVSLNYRLGRFGFFGFPELTRQKADDGRLGNYGFMDQIAALQWVRDNIASFGGDPSRVTVFGESAGGGSVINLLTSPEAKGLFARAIIQSGGGRQPLMGERRLSSDLPGQASSETLGVNFARRHGIDGTDAAALAALRNLPSDQIADGLNVDSLRQNADTYGGPMTDGRIVTQTPQAAFQGGASPGIPVMVGETSADIGFFNAGTKDEAFASFGPLAAQARLAYDPDGTLDLKTLNILIGRDRVMAEPAHFVARTRAAHGWLVYRYRFSYVTSSKEAEWQQGVPHAEEVAYVFDTLAAEYGAALNDHDRAVAAKIHGYWVAFAKGNMPDWPAYDPRTDRIMDFQRDGEARVVPDPAHAELNVVEAGAGAK